MDIGLTVIVCGFIIAGCTCRFAVLLKRTKSYLIRFVGCVVLYSLSGYFVYSGATVVAQTFSADSQTTLTRPRNSPDSLWQQQMTELVSFMRSQELLEARRVGDREDVLRRLGELEKIHPDSLAIEINTLKENVREEKEVIEKDHTLLLSILVSLIAALFVACLAALKRAR